MSDHFIALQGDAPNAVTSPDGVTWTTHAMPPCAPNPGYSSVAFGGGIYCALGYGTNGATCSNGTPWEPQTIPSGYWVSIAYGDGVFCAVDNLTDTAITSADGVTWTPHTLPTLGSVGNWNQVIWCGSFFLASNGYSGNVITSPDGITWTTQTPTGLTGIGVETFIWTGSVVCGISLDGKSATSSDGANWTAGTPISGPPLTSSLAYNGTKFVTQDANNPTTFWISSDGLAWSSEAVGVFSDTVNITSLGTLFLAVQVDSTAAAKSADGVTWTPETMPATSWNGIETGIGVGLDYGGGNSVLPSKAYVWGNLVTGIILDTIDFVLTGDVFTGTNGSPVPGITINNVPAGLTAQVIRTSDTDARLSFTGTAVAHTPSDGISNLEVIFSDVSFVTGPAAVIIGHDTTGLSITWNIPCPIGDASYHSLLLSKDVLYGDATNGSVYDSLSICIYGDAIFAGTTGLPVPNVILEVVGSYEGALGGNLTGTLIRTSDKTALLSYTGNANNWIPNPVTTFLILFGGDSFQDSTEALSEFHSEFFTRHTLYYDIVFTSDAVSRVTLPLELTHTGSTVVLPLEYASGLLGEYGSILILPMEGFNGLMTQVIPNPLMSAVTLMLESADAAIGTFAINILPMEITNGVMVTGTVTDPFSPYLPIQVPMIVANGSLIYGIGSRQSLILPIASSIAVTGMILGSSAAVEFEESNGLIYQPDILSSSQTLFIELTNSVLFASAATFYTITMHTERQALTEYTNFNFNSYCQFAGKAIAAGDAGMFSLDGETDNGAQINSTVTFGIHDLGDSNLKRVYALYLSGRSSDKMNLQVRTEDTEVYSYTIPAFNKTGLLNHRFILGRGALAKYWQFSLSNMNGADFELESVEAVPLHSHRRVGNNAGRR